MSGGITCPPPKLSKDEVSRAVSNAFGITVESVDELEYGDTWAYMVVGDDTEISIRCSEYIGGCEVMVRYMDAPAIYCGKKCMRDSAAKHLTSELERDLLAKTEKLRKLLGLPLLGECKRKKA